MKPALFLTLLALPLVGCHPSNPLRNDAYDYYGLGNTKTLKLQIVRGESGLPEEATRTVVPGKAEDDKESYVLKQTGGLETEGDITLSLEKDGIYAMSSSRNKIKPHSLEMPAKLEVGGGWKDHTEMSDQKIVLDNDLKIAGKERVTTPGGTFDDALHVTSTGSGVYQGSPVTLTTESWYVRGTGPVKQIVNVVPKTGPKQSFTIQLAPDKPAGNLPRSEEMTLLAALVLAQAPVSPAAEFFPLVPGTRRTYEVKGTLGTTTLVDIVGAKPVFFDDQPATAIVQKNQFNETLGTTYYRVDGPLVSIVGSAEDRSASTPNVGDAYDLTHRAEKRNVLMQLTPAMPVFRYEGKETSWVYGEVPVYRAIGDAEPIKTDKTLIKGTAKPGAIREVLGRKVDTIEVRAEVQLNEGLLAQRIVETSVYGRGIGLVEAVRKTTSDGRTQELRTRLVAIEEAKGG